MTPRNITPSQLRDVSFPTNKNGYETDKVDAVISMCAQTIEDLEDQITQLQQAVALARSESAPIELSNINDDEDAIAQWLTTLDPLKIDREVQKNIAEALVESTMAASHIRSEARERVKTLIDAVALEVQKLVTLTKESRKSVAAAQDLPNALAQWQGEFSGNISVLLQQLQLPWTVQVSQLAKVLAHMSESHADETLGRVALTSERVGKLQQHVSMPSHTTGQLDNEEDPITAPTTSGDWG